MQPGAALKIAPISVIIPCYNCSNEVENAVQSVFNQTVKPAELILIDDCSNDNGMTMKMLTSVQSRFMDVISTRVLQTSSNSGPGVARNLGLSVQTQPYTAFLDSDEVWHSAKIETQYLWMLSHPDVFLTCYRKLSLESLSASIETTRIHCFWRIDTTSLLFSNCISTGTVMLRAPLPHCFSDSIRFSEDYHLWLRLCIDGYSMYYLDAALTSSPKRLFGDYGLSSQLTNMYYGEIQAYWDLFRTQRINSISLLGVLIFSSFSYLRRLILSSFRSLGNHLVVSMSLSLLSFPFAVAKMI